MNWEKWEPSPRDTLIDKVRRGQLTPKDAEAEAGAKGIGPLAETADTVQFDPLRMPWWTLPMAVAWIAWREVPLVREHCADYRENCTHWVARSWNFPTADGKQFERIDGWELEKWQPTTLTRLMMEEAFMRSTGTFPTAKQMTVADAEKRLWEVLGEGTLIAVARDNAESVVEIPKRDWSYLKHYEEKDQDVLKLHVLDDKPAYKDVKIARNDLMRLWQASPFEANMIEPMTRTSTAGYVPLSSALMWICTKAGTEAMDLEDVELWDDSVAQLLSLISSGEIEILGRLNSGGPSEKIPSHYFASIIVSRPLSDYPFLFSDDPWISCTPFIDLQHWNGDFNDKVLLEKSGPATWTHLQVKKSDVLREFSSIQPRTLPSPSDTGALAPPIILKRKAGRKPQYDWQEVELFVIQALDTRGDFDEANQVDDWRCQADLERSVADYFSKSAGGQVPAISLIRRKIRPMVDAWRSNQRPPETANN